MGKNPGRIRGVSDFLVPVHYNLMLENVAAARAAHRRSTTGSDSPRRSTAMKLHTERTTAVRRRGSLSTVRALIQTNELNGEDGDEDVRGISNKGKGKTRARHARSHTEDSNHPLDYAQQQSVSTRPRLARLLSALEGAVAPPEPLQSPRRAHVKAVESAERVVLVHTIASSDSLAGVSLKYGINLAELRKANQLWASDSIHLRKYLYIPVDQASKAADFMDPPVVAPAAEPLPLSLPASEQQQHDPWAHEASETAWSDTLVDVGEPSTSPPILKSPMSTIRRIPASQLSFFPPASSSSSFSKPSSFVSSSTPHRNPTLYNTISSSKHLRSTTPSNNTSLWGTGTGTIPRGYASLLTALPDALTSFARQQQPNHLPTPSRSRPSFEAARSFETTRTPSFESSRSDTAASDEHVELNDVSYHTRNGKAARAARAAIPSFAGSPPTMASNASVTGTIPLTTRTGSSHARALSSSSSFAVLRTSLMEKMEPAKDAAPVRTVQMAPSPSMQLPTRKSPGPAAFKEV